MTFSKTTPSEQQQEITEILWNFVALATAKLIARLGSTQAVSLF